jgi:hypothetical protein
LRISTLFSVNPVRNSSGALNPAGIVLKCNPAAERRGIISNGVKKSFPKMLRFFYNVILKTIDTKGTENKKSIRVGNSGG